MAAHPRYRPCEECGKAHELPERARFALVGGAFVRTWCYGHAPFAYFGPGDPPAAVFELYRINEDMRP